MNSCQTENKRRGRKPKPGQSVRWTIRFREGEDDEIIARLRQLPKGQVSEYIKRILAGTPMDMLDQAMVESDALSADLDSMLDDWDDE